MEFDPYRLLAASLAEAFGNGSPLVTSPTAFISDDTEGAEHIAGLVLDLLELPVCGLRFAPGPDGSMLAGPMIEGRLLDSGACLTCASLPQARASAAMVGILAAALDPAETTAPVIETWHPAIDVSASRFQHGPADRFAALADLSSLGMVVIGPAIPAPIAPLALGIAPEGGTAPLHQIDPAPLFAAAAVEARRLGGLPKGALLVIAGLGADSLAIAAGQSIHAIFPAEITVALRAA